MNNFEQNRLKMANPDVASRRQALQQQIIQAQASKRLQKENDKYDKQKRMMRKAALAFTQDMHQKPAPKKQVTKAKKITHNKSHKKVRGLNKAAIAKHVKTKGEKTQNRQSEQAIPAIGKMPIMDKFLTGDTQGAVRDLSNVLLKCAKDPHMSLENTTAKLTKAVFGKAYSISGKTLQAVGQIFKPDTSGKSVTQGKGENLEAYTEQMVNDGNMPASNLQNAKQAIDNFAGSNEDHSQYVADITGKPASDLTFLQKREQAPKSKLTPIDIASVDPELDQNNKMMQMPQAGNDFDFGGKF